MARRGTDGLLYRADGVRITHDPFAPGMAAKYGQPGKTDREGFDPYADSVGAGIYSGTVERDAHGAVKIGRQYQGHNPRPGPIYSGGGYTPVSRAIASFRAETAAGAGAASTTLAKLLDEWPDLVNDVSTGGALPLHTAGMSRENQHAAAFLAARGADIEAIDTYGFTPLHRMASNNLAVGAQVLLDAGADPRGTGLTGSTPHEVARQGGAADVIATLQRFGAERNAGPGARVTALVVVAPGFGPVGGRYVERDGEQEVPPGFADVCRENGWDSAATWRKLNGGEGGRYFAHEESESYIYYNSQDESWWIDGPDGLGAYKAPGVPWAPPASEIRWATLRKDDDGGRCPTLVVLRGAAAAPGGPPSS